MVQHQTYGIDAIRSADPDNPGVIVRIKGRHVVLVEHALDTGGYGIRVWDPTCDDTDPTFTFYTNMTIEPA
jgi:hypothetical protein